MSHRHYCDFAGHDWQCSEDCECLCGLPMEGNDHGDCPVELRACPEHASDQQRSSAEAIASQPDPESILKWQELLSARPHCECGCAEAEFSNVVGWCLHCDYVYVNYSPEIENRHFASDCPGAPEELRKSAQERLVRH